MLDADHDLLGPAEASVTIRASEFKAIESLVRSSLSVLSYTEHFDIASTKLLQQLLTEVGQSSLECGSPQAQMLLNLKLSQARALSHLANIEAKLLGNVVPARRDSFLARSKVARDQQLKNFLRTSAMTHTSLFAVKSHLWQKNLRRVRGGHQVFTTGGLQSPPLLRGSKITLSLHGWAQPARFCNSRQSLSVSSTRVTSAKREGHQTPGGPAKRPRTGSKNLWLDRVVASPCPEHHFAVDPPLPSVPVGGRLSLFLDSWRSITRDQYVLHLLQHGLHLSFESQPLLTTSPVPFPLPEAHSKREHLRAEIISKLEKGAIEIVVNKSSLGFYSLLFVIPKKNGKLRLVIDLRSLNHHLRKENFYVETPANLRHSIQKGDWVISLDLTDAYLHVPIHPSSRKFLRFCYQDEVFQFRVLPFGLSVNPRVFTRVVDVMMAHVRSLGLQVHHYLDDWLLRNQQLDHLRTQTQGLLHLTTRLGWIPSLEKSELSPTQDLSLSAHIIELIWG